MKALIQWAVRNSPAMNTLMIAGVVVGAFSLMNLRREVFPEFDLEIILISVPYPGASPDEVEEGICLKIEEAVRSIEGIKYQTSVAQEGAGHVVLELEAEVEDVQKVLNEVRSEVDRIPSFPLLAEEREVKQITMRQPVISVGIVGPDDDSTEAELRLREVAERVRDDLLQQPAVSQASIVGARQYQIDVEIPEDTLRKYGLSLKQVANIIRRENVEIPGGTMRTDSQEVLLRGKNKRLLGEEILDIPLVTAPGGVVLTVGDLGTVRDEFDDSITSISRINGKPGLVISVERTTSEDLLAMVADVKSYVAGQELPEGFEMMTWADQSKEVRERLDMLRNNGLQGLVLVFVLLAIFLRLRLAFWVALGIPISILGACAVLFAMGHTMNMLTSFAFLMVLGILVDDAIVIGENIYAHHQRGKSFYKAAIDGTYEVFPSVAAGVTTTIIAFVPLLYVAGVMGKFLGVLPVAVIAALAISLIESVTVLPCHLSHDVAHSTVLDRARHWRSVMRPGMRYTLGTLLVVFAFVIRQFVYPFERLADLFGWLNKQAQQGLAFVIQRIYRPALRFSIDHPATTISVAVAIFLVSFGLIASGKTPFNVFPQIDSNQIQARITYPDGTPAAVTDAATRRIEAAILAMNEKFQDNDGTPVVRFVHRTVGQVSAPEALTPDARSAGSHVGGVDVELADTTKRSAKSSEIIAAWRQAAGDFPGAESLTFGTPNFGPGGRPIEFKLLGPTRDMAELETAVEETKAKLAQYAGVFDVADDSQPGKWEFQLRVKPNAMAMGIPTADLAETVRGSYYGEEVMRLQRGRHEVKLMVRYPAEDRRSLADFEEIRVRTIDGAERPITELADVDVTRGYSEINRIEQLRSITITADVDETIGNAFNIVNDLRTTFMPSVLDKHPSLRVLWQGQQERTVESVDSLTRGLGVALIAMFVLLTIEFRSYFQPMIVMAVIPFGIIGAVWGHFLQGMEMTMFSLFGIVALTGVVVNDSIVLIDFINHRLNDGFPLKDALVAAGTQRFRPVLLTSVTTVAGLMPILLERSFQAQIVIPMATSLCFGLMMATLLVLFLIPTLYYVYALASGTGGTHEPVDSDPAGSGPAPEEPWVEPEADAVTAGAGNGGNGINGPHAQERSVSSASNE
ncbi:MAG: AcrB/AcrD/AcrF family protein [Planctomycetota bacterium]|nr:MAG: AcrB/AcrD/AcrF family protein [Planctomycetota bacterium]